MHLQTPKPSFRIILLIGFLIGYLLSARVLYADESSIRIAADPWCPYNCSPDTALQGFMVDIAREALALEGFQLNYELINWARAKLLVKAGELDGIIGMNRSTASEPLYQFSNTPLGFSQICFYKRAGEPWAFESVDSLENQTLGWINQYWFGEDTDLDAWVERNKDTTSLVTVAGDKVYQRLFSLLQSQRIDTFAEDRQVVAYMLNQAQLSERIVPAGCSRYIEEVHLAFSLKAEHSKQWAEALDRGVAKLKKAGKLSTLLAPYGLNVKRWQAPYSSLTK